MRNIVRQPVTGTDFFERPKLIKKIQKALDAKLPVLFTGPIKSGKTSILFFLRDSLDEYYYLVYIDAGSMTNVYDYYDTIYDNLGEMDPLEHHHEDLSEPANANEIIRLLSAYDEETLLVIMIDNFSQILENIYKNEGPEAVDPFLKIEREFRSRLETVNSYVRLIYSSSLSMETISNKFNASRRINDLYPIKIPPLSDGEAEEFIHALTENTDFDLAWDQVRYLCKKMRLLTPFHIQLVFFELGSIYLDKDLSAITTSTIDDALELVLKNKEYIEHWKNHLQIFPPIKNMKN